MAARRAGDESSNAYLTTSARIGSGSTRPSASSRAARCAGAMPGTHRTLIRGPSRKVGTRVTNGCDQSSDMSTGR